MTQFTFWKETLKQNNSQNNKIYNMKYNIIQIA